MKKNIQVFTSDPDNARITLSIAGTVLNFAKIEPKYARLVGQVGTDIKKVVTITREKDYPFSILQTKVRNGKNITFTLAEFSKSGVDGYTLTIENKKTEAGRYADTLTLVTDSPIKSTIQVPVYGQIIAVPPKPGPTLPQKKTSGG